MDQDKGTRVEEHVAKSYVVELRVQYFTHTQCHPAKGRCSCPLGPCRARTEQTLGRASLACALEHRLALDRPAHHVVHISDAATHTGVRKG